MNTRTLLIVAGVAAVAGGVWYYRHKQQMNAAALEAQRLKIAVLTNPQLVADALREADQRRNAGANLWRALNPQKA